MNQIKISIIVPCYNNEKWVGETIESIKNQTYDSWECIIVNDGSTDNSQAVIEENIKGDSRFTLVNTENNGVGHARNIALNLCKGEYVLPIDSDDLLEPDYTLNGVDFLDRNKDYSLYYGRAEVLSDNPFYTTHLYKDYPTMLMFDCICVSGIYRKEHALSVGGYNEEIKALEDFEFWVRYLYHNDKIMLSDEIGFKYRMRDDSRHHSLEPKQRYLIRKKIINLNKEIYYEYKPMFERGYCIAYGL